MTSSEVLGERPPVPACLLSDNDEALPARYSRFRHLKAEVSMLPIVALRLASQLHSSTLSDFRGQAHALRTLRALGVPGPASRHLRRASLRPAQQDPSRGRPGVLK